MMKKYFQFLLLLFVFPSGHVWSEDIKAPKEVTRVAVASDEAPDGVPLEQEESSAEKENIPEVRAGKAQKKNLF